MKNLLILLLALLPMSCKSSKSDDQSVTFKHFPKMESDFIPARDVMVMLPPGYNEAQSYPVLYMHDGQMLFDSATTWNEQEWGMDEVITKLIREKKIRPVIVVGIYNTENRALEYMPNAPKAELDTMERPKGFEGEVMSDHYLKFLTKELKPFIDETFATQPGPGNTFIMGSSMGGLISCYAISEYPGVFGGAACLSTHWPAMDGVFLKYVEKNLPEPATHKIYFDYGTATLDSLYEPFQEKVDVHVANQGYIQGENWMTKKFKGADHSENAWRKRVHIPLEFLLRK
ncbi:alpha/beta hydrolase [Marinilabilia rubra]|uniref:Esterase n=1 Tax=Marinilabilia rubra TaxID=2162893 RepID=A0A2U2B921_9BACT|nr:alpha/beta hydrolase-fold protein [Marinilabilia rubra]PWD99557.1 esterase [Marinilabilia rubra]